MTCEHEHTHAKACMWRWSHAPPCLCATNACMLRARRKDPETHQERHQLWEDPPVCPSPHMHGHTHLSLKPGRALYSCSGLCWGTGLLSPVCHPSRAARLALWVESGLGRVGAAGIPRLRAAHRYLLHLSATQASRPAQMGTMGIATTPTQPHRC